MSMEESISLEETNKIRISLGLKPLTDDSAPADDKDKQAEDNYAKQRELQNKQRESKKIQDRIAKIKNRHELNASLKGSTLGDADGDDDNDTLKWIKKSKKREKQLAKQRLAELESMDKVFQGDEYTERDLVGLKVSHDFEDMDEGDARILTLKDSRILDNEEDELQNVEMAEAERTKKNNELKIKKRDYTGYDDEEFVPGHEGMKRSVLSKYDEELDGIQETGFRLGNSVETKAAKVEKQQHAAAAMVNKSLLTIDYAKTFATTDYLQEGDVGFKKPRTKKKRSSRRAPEAEPVPDDQMEVDEKPVVPRARDLDANFVDDDDLQAVLARSRKAKLHKATKMTPEQLAQKIAEQRAQEEAEAREIVKAEELDDGEDGSGGLTFDDTSEFVRAVGNNPIVKEERKEQSVVPSKQPSHSRDVSMAPGDEAIQELEAGEVEMKDEEEEDERDDAAILDAIENLMKSVEAEQAENSQFGIADDGIGGTASEQTFRSGLAGTVNILRQQGVLAKPAEEQQYREQVQIDRDRWLAQQRRAIEQREMERWQSRGSNKDQATREQLNRQREQQEVRDTVELFKSYKPDVNLVYYDEYGRSMTPKEAWKALSHRFHGKGSGKMKTEKRQKKIKDEEKQQAMSSGDTPLSMTKAFQLRQEKTGQAHMVLSVGNRGAVPQAAEFFDAQPLGKGNKAEKSKKKKEGKGVQPAESGFMTLPAPQMQSLMASANASPVPSGISSGSPAPKPGFSRISSAVDSPSQTGSDGGERSKVTFGFGTKRKAGEDAEGTPPAKRR
ncbi:SART-1 family-domain-containing protein [Mycena maculata]|uniref:SART-1 family-domain-containing protein n=1 Tax=Mycena maculata TaxID=230809 RepID=A0AAD7J490_9AGAR|nr:SART-1 family-domain-containing protein [Mycena maculata]